MAFNECTFGFVPHSGATWYLSRLPSEFGTFLALTGMPISGPDCAKLKLVDGILQTTTDVEDLAADVVYSRGYDPREKHDFFATHERRIKRGSAYPSNSRINTGSVRHLQQWGLAHHASDKADL